MDVVLPVSGSTTDPQGCREHSSRVNQRIGDRIGKEKPEALALESVNADSTFHEKKDDYTVVSL